MAYTAAELKVMSSNFNVGIVEETVLPFLVNTKWQAEATNATEVNILTVGDVTFGAYTKGTPLTLQTPGPGSSLLKMNNYQGFAIASYDVDKLVPGYIQAVATKAAKAGALIPDAAALALATKANFPTNWMAGALDVAIEVNSANISTYLRSMNTKMQKQGIPKGQRFVALPPELYEKVLIAIEEKIIVAQQTTDAMFDAEVIKIHGLNVIETNQYVSVTPATDDFKVLFGHIDAIAGAVKPISLESQRLVLEPGDSLFGVLQYGFKVVNEKYAGAAYLEAIAEV